MNMRWKSRVAALLFGFAFGGAVVLVVNLIAEFFKDKQQDVRAANWFRCERESTFKNIDEIIAALKSDDLSVRREVRKKLFVRPILQTTYFDYERDINYPERAENISLQFVQLDGDRRQETIIRFARLENPVAIVLEEGACGWEVIGTFSAWLRNEDYPYKDWLELRETVKEGVSEILLRDSTGDSTSYFRKVRLLKLIDGGFKQVAEFEEENIEPFENYYGGDWSDVKLRHKSEVSFDKNGLIKIKVIQEQIKYEGTPSTKLFFSESDGAWHTTRRHWHTREFRQLKAIDEKVTTLIWDDKRLEFQIERRQ